MGARNGPRQKSWHLPYQESIHACLIEVKQLLQPDCQAIRAAQLPILIELHPPRV
jgi:hypothetical protein